MHLCIVGICIEYHNIPNVNRYTVYTMYKILYYVHKRLVFHRTCFQ